MERYWVQAMPNSMASRFKFKAQDFPPNMLSWNSTDSRISTWLISAVRTGHGWTSPNRVWMWKMDSISLLDHLWCNSTTPFPLTKLKRFACVIISTISAISSNTMAFAPSRNYLLLSTIISRTIRFKRKIRKNYWGFVERQGNGIRKERHIAGLVVILAINLSQIFLLRWGGNLMSSAMTLIFFSLAKDRLLSSFGAGSFQLKKCLVRYRQESNFLYLCTASSK